MTDKSKKYTQLRQKFDDMKAKSNGDCFNIANDKETLETLESIQKQKEESEKDELSLELEGSIFLIHKKGSTVLSREKIDPDIAMRALAELISLSLEKMLKK